MVLSELCPVVGAQRRILHLDNQDGPQLTLACQLRLEAGNRSAKQLGLGQASSAVRARKQKNRARQFAADYLRISSGLGEASPRSVLVLPLIFEGQVKACSSLPRSRDSAGA